MTVLRSWTARCEGCPECGFRATPHSAALEPVFSHAAATDLETGPLARVANA